MKVRGDFGIARRIGLGRRVGSVQTIGEPERNKTRKGGLGYTTKANKANYACRGGPRSAKLSSTKKEWAPVIVGPLKIGSANRYTEFQAKFTEPARYSR